MDSRAPLAEAIKRLKRLIEIAAGPARREGARISSEAPSVKAVRAETRAAALAAASHAARFGWVPFYGDRVASASASAKQAAAEAEKVWMEIRRRGRLAQDALAEMKKSHSAVTRAEARIKHGDGLPARLDERAVQLLARVKFLEQTDGREVGRGSNLSPKVLALAGQLAAVIRDWDVVPAVPVRVSDQVHDEDARQQPGHNRPVETRRGKTQLALDFDGTGQVQAEPRIWLPVSSSRTREMIERGARVDREAPRRGSQLWVPVSERSPMDQFLPLAFRRQNSPFAFPPIRHNAVGQNLWSVFDKESWDHIRTTVYDRAGHRCQICGRQGGSLWNRIAPPEERKKGGVVDAHEIWDWEVIDENAGIGVQKLKRILCVCKDCHACFHEGRTMWLAREAGLDEKAAQHLKALRMAMNRCDGVTLEAQLELDKAEWESNKDIVGTWVLDLSHLATQDYMADHTLVLRDANKAGLTPSNIGGIAFRSEDGTVFGSQDARALADGQPPRPLTRPSGVR